jgi:hypothetical protein
MFKFHTMRSVSASFLVIVMGFSQPAMSQPLSNQMDIRVLIDVSGSMKKTDPSNLRIPALQVLSQLLPEGSKAGIWEFANRPTVIVPHGVVNAQWQQQATLAAKNVSSKGQFTDIGAALKAASFNAQDQLQGRQLHVILLTDGMVDVSKEVAKNKRARTVLLGPILQAYIDAGARVHTVGLSHKADKATLSAIAQATDGSFEVALNADQLLEIFLRALDNTVITQQVPVQVTEQSFLVQQGVESMTIVVEKNGDEAVKFKDGKQRIFGRQQTLINQQWQSSLTHDVVRVQNPTPGTWALISDTAILKRVNVVGQLQILLQQSHQNIKVGQRSYIDVQLANERGDLLSVEQLQGFKLNVTLDDGNTEVFKRQQDFLADTKTRMQLPMLNEPGMYNLTISVVNGQLMRTINRSLRVHPLVAIAANPENPPVMADDSAATELEIEVMLVSNETASPKLQTLMQDNTTNEPVIAVSDAAPSAAEATVTMSSEPAASRIANMVNQLKAKVAFGGKTTPEAVAVVPEKTLEANTNSNTSDTPAGQDATRPSYWIWLAVGAAVLVLLLLWVILRRSSKLAR